VKVGLVILLSIPRPRAIPRVKTVLPVPSVPDSEITAPALSTDASFLPISIVSFSDCEKKVFS